MITKRQLGLLLLAAGLGTIVLALAVDIVRHGQWQGFGPYQQIGLAAGIVMSLLGLSLVPLGNRPA